MAVNSFWRYFGETQQPPWFDNIVEGTPFTLEKIAIWEHRVMDAYNCTQDIVKWTEGMRYPEVRLPVPSLWYCKPAKRKSVFYFKSLEAFRKKKRRLARGKKEKKTTESKKRKRDTIKEVIKEEKPVYGNCNMVIRITLNPLSVKK